MSEKLLIDRMGDAFTNMLASALPGMNWTDETGQLILREAREVLAEYRNRPPEISQATAKELLNNLIRMVESYDGDDGGGRYPPQHHTEEKSAIARAEAELKGAK